MIDHRPALILSTVKDPEKRRLMTLMAVSMEPPDRTLPMSETVFAGLVILAAIALLMLAV